MGAVDQARLELENASLRRELRNVWEANRHLTDLLAGRKEIGAPELAGDADVVAELVDAVASYKPVKP